VRTDRYDILAKAQSRASLTAMSGDMLQGILTDRFRLHIRQEIRDTRAYVLTVAVGCPKMRRAQRTDCDESLDAAVPVRRDETGRVRPVLSDKLPCGFLHIGNAANGTAVIQGLYVAIPELARLLGSQLDRPLIDRTALAGHFNFDMSFLPLGLTPVPDADLSAPSLFAAVQEQLGLKLEATRAGVEFFVIDRVERPQN